MATHQPPSAPSPDSIHLALSMLTWIGQQTWAIVALVIFALGKAFFGNYDKRLDGVEDGQKQIMEILTKIQIDQAEIKGELKGRKPTK